MNTIGENIKNFRIFRKMTQVELGAAVGRSKNVVSNWERGDNTPDLDTLEKICRVLSVTPNQIFGWDICPEYEEHKQKIGEANSKPINMYDISGTFIRSFVSAYEAEAILRINHSHISQCCHGHRQTTGGYKWSFAQN